MNLNFQDIVKSKTFKGFIMGILVLLILIVVFQAGVWVGFKKANFSMRLADNYGRIFGTESRSKMMGGMFADLPPDNIPGSHGAVGSVIKIASSTMVVAEPNNIEKIVLFTDKTIVRKSRETIKSDNIKVGDSVSVLGEANNQGEIEAKFVRVIPTK